MDRAAPRHPPDLRRLRPDRGSTSAPAGWAAALALGALLASGCMAARGTPDEPVVLSFHLEGVKAVDAEDLRLKLATQPSGRYRWSQAWRLDPDALAVDKRRVEAYYRERGYYRAKVDSVDVVPAGEGRVRVAFRIVEGPPVKVARLVVTGLEDAPEARAKAGRLRLREGEVFTEAAYDATRAQLAMALSSTGYAIATVTQQARVLPDEGTAEVGYQVVPGPRFKFGRVFVAGTAAVPRGRIADQAALEIRQGDWYDEARLSRAQTRVFDLGVFAGVRVSRGNPDPETKTVPVVVSVREAAFKTVRVGPGLGFEMTRWEAQALASWTHRNFLGDLRKLQLDLKLGYAWIPNPFDRKREGPVVLLSSEFTQPFALGRQVDASARIELERSLEEAYGFYSERLKLGTPVRLASRWTFLPSYNLEVYQMTDLVTSAGLPPVQFQNCPGDVCLLSYLEQRVAWDGRDDPIMTRRGLYASLSLQEGFHLGGAGYSYFRFMPEGRAYVPLNQDTVVAARLRLGALIPIAETGAAPLQALFTSGGPLQMRGYATQRLSPMALQDDLWVATGGNGVLDAGLELRTSYTGNLGGAFFLDAGNVSDASSNPAQYQQVLDLTKLQLAVGTGLRYLTPFGPLRVDVALRVPTVWSAGVPFNERFPPVPGDSGHREPIAALHLSLGEAF